MPAVNNADNATSDKAGWGRSTPATPSRLRVMTPACGQRCHRHNLHGVRPPRYSNPKAARSNAEEAREQKSKSCFGENNVNIGQDTNQMPVPSRISNADKKASTSLKSWRCATSPAISKNRTPRPIREKTIKGNKAYPNSPALMAMTL